jgi:hypothetical protein
LNPREGQSETFVSPESSASKWLSDATIAAEGVRLLLVQNFKYAASRFAIAWSGVARSLSRYVNLESPFQKKDVR